jgi:hypothetical protein
MVIPLPIENSEEPKNGVAEIIKVGINGIQCVKVSFIRE